MADIADFHDAITNKIRGSIPDFQHVEKFYGLFNIPEVMRRSFESPAAFVSIPTFKPGNAYSDGRITFLAEVMIFILSTSMLDPEQGSIDAAVVCQKLMVPVVKLAKWSAFGMGMPPTEIEANELHYDKLDPQGMAMSVVSWQQEILIGDEDQFFGREQSKMPDFSFPRCTSVKGGDAAIHMGAPPITAAEGAHSTPIPGEWT